MTDWKLDRLRAYTMVLDDLENMLRLPDNAPATAADLTTTKEVVEACIELLERMLAGSSQ